MSFAATGRLTCLGAGSLLSILVGVLIAPSAVHASCGDYVSVGSHGKNEIKPGPPEVQPDSTPRPLHLPCRGPGCSRREAPPPAPTPTVTTPLQEQWALSLVSMTKLRLGPLEGWHENSLPGRRRTHLDI